MKKLPICSQISFSLNPRGFLFAKLHSCSRFSYQSRAHYLSCHKYPFRLPLAESDDHCRIRHSLTSFQDDLKLQWQCSLSINFALFAQALFPSGLPAVLTSLFTFRVHLNPSLFSIYSLAQILVFPLFYQPLPVFASCARDCVLELAT